MHGNSLVPRPSGRRGRYILFAHARNHPDIPRCLDSIVTCPWHDDVTVSILRINMDRSISYALVTVISYGGETPMDALLSLVHFNAPLANTSDP